MITVVIPNYKRCSRLIRAIKSIEKQTYCKNKIEVIVVDDCSPNFKIIDEMIEEYKSTSKLNIKHIRHDINKFASAARNTGIKMAKNKFVALLDSDDEWYPNYLDCQIENYLASEKHDNLILFGSCINTVGNDSWISPKRDISPGEHVSEYIFLKMQSCQTSTLFSTKDNFQNNLFDESLKAFQDHSFALNAFGNGCLLQWNECAKVIRYLDWNENNDHVGNKLSVDFLLIWLEKHKTKMTKKAILSYKIRYLYSFKNIEIWKETYQLKDIYILKIIIKSFIKDLFKKTYNIKLFQKVRLLLK